MSLHDLQAALGVEFKDPALLRQALAHRSYLYEHPDEELESNERLEYLGDAVLTLVSSLYLFRTFPDLQEGPLTTIRAAAVRGETLAKFAQQIDLGRYLLLGRGEAKSGGAKRPLLLASAFEAVVGALVLDQGIDVTTTFLERILVPEIRDIVAERRHENAKSLLQEYSQGELAVTPEYRTVRVTGPGHARTFTVEVLVGEEAAGRGEGPSKQAAEEAAAREALTRLKAR